MGHPQPPGQRGIYRADGGSGPLEGGDRALEVGSLDQGIADQPLDGRRSKVGPQAFGEPQKRVGMARADELRSACLEQAGNLALRRRGCEHRERRVEPAL
jgi:hypothetical protein